VDEWTFDTTINSQGHKLLEDIELEPLSSRVVRTIWAEGPIPEVKKLPKRMELFLEFRMVGPIQRLRHPLRDFLHDPRLTE